MGRTVNQKTNDGSSQSIDSCSHQNSSISLLVLPNELLDIILSYLSSSDIVQAFLHINSCRIQALIQNYLVHFNLVSVIADEKQWIKTYFIEQSELSDYILSLCLTERQMKFLSKYNVQFAQLKSFHIVNIEDNSVLLIDILKMAPFLHSLSFDFLAEEMSHDSISCLAQIVFSDRTTWQQQIQTLSINNIHVPFGFNSLHLMPYLRHVTINVRYESQLFNLCSHLPRLKMFYVDVRHSSSIPSDQSIENLVVSPYLRKLVVSGSFSSYATLYKFILVYKSSIKDLRLMNIYHPDLVDGHQLRSELVKYLTPSIRFQFQFQFQFQVNIKEFHTDNYLKTFDWTQVMINSKVNDGCAVMVVSSLPALRSSW